MGPLFCVHVWFSSLVVTGVGSQVTNEPLWFCQKHWGVQVQKNWQSRIKIAAIVFRVSVTCHAWLYVTDVTDAAKHSSGMNESQEQRTQLGNIVKHIVTVLHGDQQ